MCFSGNTIAPVATDKTETSVRILGFIIISFGAGGSDWLIKFGALGTFRDCKYSLGMKFFSEVGATKFSFACFFLSFDDSESLGASSSSLAIFYLFI